MQSIVLKETTNRRRQQLSIRLVIYYYQANIKYITKTLCRDFCSLFYFFFFSSRRRHTRCSRDWSSDVCSSDLSWTRRSLAPSGRASSSRTGPRVWWWASRPCRRSTRSPWLPGRSDRSASPSRWTCGMVHRSRRRRSPGRHSTSHVRPSPRAPGRSEEHTSELQSRLHLVCRLLLEK